MYNRDYKGRMQNDDWYDWMIDKMDAFKIILQIKN